MQRKYRAIFVKRKIIRMFVETSTIYFIGQVHRFFQKLMLSSLFYWTDIFTSGGAVAPNTLPVGTPTARRQKSWDSLDQSAMQQARGKPGHQQVIHLIVSCTACL